MKIKYTFIPANQTKQNNKIRLKLQRRDEFLLENGYAAELAANTNEVKQTSLIRVDTSRPTLSVEHPENIYDKYLPAEQSISIKGTFLFSLTRTRRVFKFRLSKYGSGNGGSPSSLLLLHLPY